MSRKNKRKKVTSMNDQMNIQFIPYTSINECKDLLEHMTAKEKEALQSFTGDNPLVIPYYEPMFGNSTRVNFFAIICDDKKPSLTSYLPSICKIKELVDSCKDQFNFRKTVSVENKSSVPVKFDGLLYIMRSLFNNSSYIFLEG